MPTQIPCNHRRCLTVHLLGLGSGLRRYTHPLCSVGMIWPPVVSGTGRGPAHAVLGRGYGGSLTGRQKRGGDTVDDLNGKVAVVTGGAAGIGRGIVEALLDEGCPGRHRRHRGACARGRGRGAGGRAASVRGVVTDVSGPRRWRRWPTASSPSEGACHLLWNNAGVTSGGGGNPWEQEPNDWRWCFGVNVFGAANGVLAFVPRMIASGEPGVVVTTSSGDGGIAPVPYASVYASSQGGHLLPHRGPGPPVRSPRAPSCRRPSSTRRAACSRPACGRPSATGRRAGPGAAPAPGARAPRSPSSRRSPGRRRPPDRRRGPRRAGRFAVQGVKEGRSSSATTSTRPARLLHARADAIGRGAAAPSALER